MAKKPTETLEEGDQRLKRFEAAKAAGDTEGMWDNANAPSSDKKWPTQYSIWLKRRKTGWEMLQDGYDTLADAFGGLEEFMNDEFETNVVGGCVMKDGNKPTGY